MKPVVQFILFSAAVVFLQACGEQSSPLDAENTGHAGSETRSLYVTSGGCYAGGAVTSAGSNTVAVLDADTGALKRVLVDYAAFSPGDTPVSVTDYDATHVLVAVENASGRRLDLVNKDGSGVTTYLVNSGALTGVLRSMKRLSDGSVLLAKSTAIEKFSGTRARITQGANAFVNAPASACATSTTMMVGLETLSNGKIVYAHAAASANNKIGLISAAGYATTADCLGTQAAPTTLALPTALLVHSSGRLLVAYGSTTAASNSVYSYDLDPATNVFSNATSAFADVSIVNGPSALAEDPTTGVVYVANSVSTANSIERFQYNLASRTMTRIGAALGPNLYTRCISSMKLLAE